MKGNTWAICLFAPFYIALTLHAATGRLYERSIAGCGVANIYCVRTLFFANLVSQTNMDSNDKGSSAPGNILENSQYFREAEISAYNFDAEVSLY